MDESEARAFLAGEEVLEELEDHGTITIYADRDTTAFGQSFRAGESVTIQPRHPELVAVAQALDAAMESGGPWRGWITSEFLERFGVPVSLGEDARDFWSRVY